MTTQERLQRAYRLVVVLAATSLTLGVVCALYVPAIRSARRESATPDDAEARRLAIAQLVDRGSGVWDAAVDADVGHLLAPDLVEREHAGVRITSDRLGLRERDFALPKPAGTVRVVLLGDSFVMGHGVAADDRLGVFLERFLKERAGPAAPVIECLHVGVDTWNVHAECAYLRRALALFAPDLVVQVVIGNDVDDNPGARGFGTLAAVDPIHPERAASLFQVNGPQWLFGIDTLNFLSHGFDDESRTRYAAAAADIAGLARAVADAGGAYFAIDHFGPLLPVARARLLAAVAADRQLHLPRSFFEQPELHVSPKDWHWSRRGHEEVAQLVYAAIRARSLLPRLTLEAWPEAEARFERVASEGASEAARDADLALAADASKIAPSIDFTQLGKDGAAQVHGGISRGGLVCPYAAVILRCEGRHALVVEGARLKRRELADARVKVFVDEAPVGEFALGGVAAFAERFEVPSAIASRRFVTARFVASDFVVAGPDLRSTLSLQLRRLALE